VSADCQFIGEPRARQVAEPIRAVSQMQLFRMANAARIRRSPCRASPLCS
jgi:hypothetical protein